MLRRQLFSLGKMVFSHQFRTLGEIFPAACSQVIDVIIKTASKKNSAVLTKLHSTCPQEEFERKLFFKEKYSFVFIILGNSAIYLRLFVRHFRQRCQNCILRVQKPEEHFDEEKLFRKVRFFIFSPWSEICQTLERLSKVLFLCPEEPFEEEQLLRKHFLYSFLNWKVPWELSEGKFVFIEKKFFYHQLRLLVEHFSAFIS